jgi:putative tryptophan/tyrosine transport system substrate-binding protein
MTRPSIALQVSAFGPQALLLSAFSSTPRIPTSTAQISDVQAAARSLGIGLRILNASSEREIDAAFGSAAQQHVNAVVVGADSVFLSRRDQLVGLAARYALPSIYYVREFAVAGGLISYGASITDAYRLAGRYAGRILGGEKPADLPIQQTVQFELAINLKTAKSLGLTVSPSLLTSADEVIE